MNMKYQMTLFSLLAISVLIAPACAEPAVTTWTAYLYEGPSSHYAVVDEVPQATPVEIAACNGEWCEVTIRGRVGFLRAEIVAKGDPSKPADHLLPQPAAAPLQFPPRGSCVQANQTGGNGGNAPTVFCLKKSDTVRQDND